jgi:hypothetical protein
MLELFYLFNGFLTTFGTDSSSKTIKQNKKNPSRSLNRSERRFIIEVIRIKIYLHLIRQGNKKDKKNKKPFFENTRKT